MFETIGHDVEIDFGVFSLTGDVRYDEEQSALILADRERGFPEHLSVSLLAYGGLIPEPGCVFVKDWSEHEGLAHQLVAAGLGEISDEVRVGPFRMRAYQLKINR